MAGLNILIKIMCLIFEAEVYVNNFLLLRREESITKIPKSNFKKIVFVDYLTALNISE